MKIKKVSDYQKEYDAMVKVAKQSISNGVELSPAFVGEITRLMNLVRSMGGKV
jgi:hypothetical protein